MSTASSRERQTLSPILFVKNLNYSTTGADLYDVFGRYGAIRQVRIGDGPKTKGTAYIAYEEVADAKNALDHLNGFYLNSRYIVVLFHMPAKLTAQMDLAKREAELERLKQQHDIKDSD
ncbi:hypothetical protein OC835_000858 [Tilletia horrida]|uniref:RRM domain-containing protein n=1 Tax=Tilletia horrida TaxID=155126 RepID=A0AAN6GGJ9_9BASI|nr:hypothetical protein OC842_000958 [Tilletia horrida]KAK0540060.1 hypothetical protein OC835_000858 [Tilletia horrida]KAK0566005.1 hypothetical protein OC844_000968 [Tilletia horrida]